MTPYFTSLSSSGAFRPRSRARPASLCNHMRVRVQGHRRAVANASGHDCCRYACFDHLRDLRVTWVVEPGASEMQERAARHAPDDHVAGRPVRRGRLALPAAPIRRVVSDPALVRDLGRVGDQVRGSLARHLSRSVREPASPAHEGDRGDEVHQPRAAWRARAGVEPGPRPRVPATWPRIPTAGQPCRGHRGIPEGSGAERRP